MGVQQNKKIDSEFWKTVGTNDDFYKGMNVGGRTFKSNQDLIDQTLSANEKKLLKDKAYSRRDSNFAVDIGVNIIGGQLLAAPPKNIPDSNPLTTYEQYSKYYGQ